VIKLIDILKEIKVVSGKGNSDDIVLFLNFHYKKFVEGFGDPKTKFTKQINTAEDGSKYEVAAAGIDEDYGIDVSFSPKFMELHDDDYNDIEDVKFLGRIIYVNNYLNAAPEEDEEDLDEIKVIPGGIKGIYILKTIWDMGDCDISVEVFRTEKEAKDAALSYIWEYMEDNGDTELSEKEFLSTYSFDDHTNGTIGYGEPRYEIEKVQ
jgi:hypothetical protein